MKPSFRRKCILSRTIVYLCLSTSLAEQRKASLILIATCLETEKYGIPMHGCRHIFYLERDRCRTFPSQISCPVSCCCFFHLFSLWRGKLESSAQNWLALYQTSNFLYVVRQLISFPFQWSIDLLFGFIGSSLSCTCQATLPFFVKRFEASTGLAKRRQLRTWMIHEWYMNVWKQASFKLASISANRASSLGNGLDLRLHKITKPHRSYLSHTSSSISPGKSQSLQVQWIPPGANWRKQNYSKVLVLNEQCSREWSKAQVHYHSYTYHVCGVMCACSRCVLHHKSLYLICTVDWLRQAQ